MVQARAIATRARILDQASAAFARSGYDAASLTGHILEPAGVSVGSFYHQFKNKMEVLFALLDERLADIDRQLDAALEAADSGDLGDRLAALIERAFDRVRITPELFTVQIRERSNPDARVRDAVERSWDPWRRGIASAIGDAFDDEFARGVAVEAVASTLVRMLDTYLMKSEVERIVWRNCELPLLVDFCAAGVERLAAR